MSSTFELLLSHLRQDPLMILMVATSVFVVAVALERLLTLMRGFWAVRAVEVHVLRPLRLGKLEDARRGCQNVPYPVQPMFTAALDRVNGQVQGDPAMALAREQRRAVAAYKAWLWILGTTGALMPFVGLLGTVVGVMGSFRAIGDSGQGGFAVVSTGISQALIATAVGLFVALEAVVLFNVLQNLAGAVSRRLAYVSDEFLELIRSRAGVPVAANPAGRPLPPAPVHASPNGGASAGSTPE